MTGDDFADKWLTYDSDGDHYNLCCFIGGMIMVNIIFMRGLCRHWQVHVETQRIVMIEFPEVRFPCHWLLVTQSIESDF